MPKKYKYQVVTLGDQATEKVKYLCKKLKFKNPDAVVEFLINREYARHENIVTQLDREFKTKNPQMKDFPELTEDQINKINLDDPDF